MINMFTESGKINNNAPSEYIGLDRFEARKKILLEILNIYLSSYIKNKTIQ